MRALLLALLLAGCTPTLEFTLPDLDGNQVTPVRTSGASVVAFWATWCGPCRQELSEMNEMYGRLHPKGLELYAISIDRADATGEVERWVAEQQYAFPVLLDPEKRLFSRYSFDESIPYLLIFDGGGTLVEERVGYHPDGVRALETDLASMLPAQ